jgi:DNA polymerase III sliding clamp (beta) subunit (PCNA family)
MVMQVENPDRNARWQGRISFEGTMPEGYKLALNIDYFTTMLKDIVEERIQWKHNEPDAAMILQGIGVDNELCLIMPVLHRKEESDEKPDH